MNNMMNGMETKVNALRDTIDGKIYTLDERQLRLTKQGNKLKDNISNLRVSIDYVDSDLWKTIQQQGKLQLPVLIIEPTPPTHTNAAPVRPTFMTNHPINATKD